MVKGIYYGKRNLPPPVDEWEIQPEDEVFKTGKGCLLLPVSEYYGETENKSVDLFCLATKRCYNGQKMRYHMPLYLNYFTKYYDQDKELLMVYFRMKILMDYHTNEYSRELFINDIKRYVLSQSLMNKAWAMVEDNYKMDLDSKNYRNDKNPCLQYSDRHAKILMWMSLLMNMTIPLATHFIFVKNIEDTNHFLLEIFGYILNLTDVDIFSKLYETSASSIDRNAKSNYKLWEMQDIRGIDTSTLSMDSLINIILNIIPKYTFSQNSISLNYSSIKNNAHFQVTGIKYEFSYVPLSSSNRDADENSELDKLMSPTRRNAGR